MDRFILGELAAALPKRDNLQALCSTDFPDAEFDLVALPTVASGEAELTRELLHAGYHHLRHEGELWVSSDNARDRWLGEIVRELSNHVERKATKQAAAYRVKKIKPLKKLKNYACEIVFRDGEKLLKALSRPGVFSHRKVDPGCRQILNAMTITPGMRVLDLGCGSGALSIAAAARAEGITVHAIDSHARAIECLQRGAELNGLTNITTELSSDLHLTGQTPFDLVLANPPYYSHFEIARKFLLAARGALRRGGELLLVTKSPTWYEEHAGEWFRDLEITPSKDYYLVRGKRP